MLIDAKIDLITMEEFHKILIILQIFLIDIQMITRTLIIFRLW